MMQQQQQQFQQQLVTHEALTEAQHVAPPDRSALLQSIRAGKQLHHVTRASMLQQQQQQQGGLQAQRQQQQSLHQPIVELAEPIAGVQQPAGDRGVLLRSIQAGTKLNHVHRKSMVPQQLQQQRQQYQQLVYEQQQQFEDPVDEPVLTHAVGDRGALLQAIRNGKKLQHVHRASTAQQQYQQ